MGADREQVVQKAGVQMVKRSRAGKKRSAEEAMRDRLELAAGERATKRMRELATVASRRALPKSRFRRALAAPTPSLDPVQALTTQRDAAFEPRDAFRNPRGTGVILRRERVPFVSVFKDLQPLAEEQVGNQLTGVFARPGTFAGELVGLQDPRSQLRTPFGMFQIPVPEGRQGVGAFQAPTPPTEAEPRTPAPARPPSTLYSRQMEDSLADLSSEVLGERQRTPRPSRAEEADIQPRRLFGSPVSPIQPTGEQGVLGQFRGAFFGNARGAVETIDRKIGQGEPVSRSDLLVLEESINDLDLSSAEKTALLGEAYGRYRKSIDDVAQSSPVANRLKSAFQSAKRNIRGITRVVPTLDDLLQEDTRVFQPKPDAREAIRGMTRTGRDKEPKVDAREAIRGMTRTGGDEELQEATKFFEGIDKSIRQGSDPYAALQKAISEGRVTTRRGRPDKGKGKAKFNAGVERLARAARNLIRKRNRQAAFEMAAPSVTPYEMEAKPFPRSRDTPESSRRQDLQRLRKKLDTAIWTADGWMSVTTRSGSRKFGRPRREPERFGYRRLGGSPSMPRRPSLK